MDHSELDDVVKNWTNIIKEAINSNISSKSYKTEHKAIINQQIKYLQWMCSRITNYLHFRVELHKLCSIQNNSTINIDESRKESQETWGIELNYLNTIYNDPKKVAKCK